MDEESKLVAKTTRIEITSEKSQKPDLKGKTILSKHTSVRIKEISNGFLLEKSCEVKYKDEEKDYSDYAYWTETYYSPESPIEMKEKKNKKDLIDFFD